MPTPRNAEEARRLAHALIGCPIADVERLDDEVLA